MAKEADERSEGIILLLGGSVRRLRAFMKADAGILYLGDNNWRSG
jgi:hypothetical protein